MNAKNPPHTIATRDRRSADHLPPPCELEGEAGREQLSARNE